MTKRFRALAVAVSLVSATVFCGGAPKEAEPNSRSVVSAESKKSGTSGAVTRHLLCVPKYHHNCYGSVCVEKGGPRDLSFRIQTRKDKVLLQRCEPECSGEPVPVRFRRELNGFQTIIDDGSFVFILDENLDFSRSIQDATAIRIWFGSCSKIKT